MDAEERLRLSDNAIYGKLNTIISHRDQSPFSFLDLQLSVNLAKTKVVTFGSRARCQVFTFNGSEVERVQSCKYLESGFHATKKLSHGVSKLISAANKAMHAMNRRCAFLHISDPKQRCKLFDSLALPILSYASEVWAVDKKVGESAEQLHWQFLKHVLGIRGNTATLIWLSLAAILYIFTGGSRFFVTTTASTICLMMNASFSVLL